MGGSDRILNNLRHVAYRRRLLAGRAFQFLDHDFIEADENLQIRQNVNKSSFITADCRRVGETESIHDKMRKEAQLISGWRLYSEKWALPNSM